VERIFVSDKKDFYAEAKKQMRLSERIVAAIPGFRGYKEKELRRESDKLLRSHLHLKLSKTKDALKTIFQKFSDRRYLDVITDMDRLMAKVDRITEKINHASYGYAGFFDVIKVKEENLDRMIDFDNKLVGEVEDLAVEVDTFKTEVRRGETKKAKERIQTITEKVEIFEDNFDKRGEIILGVR
jgi:hypothetical protein